MAATSGGGEMKGRVHSWESLTILISTTKVEKRTAAYNRPTASTKIANDKKWHTKKKKGEITRHLGARIPYRIVINQFRRKERNIKLLREVCHSIQKRRVLEGGEKLQSKGRGWVGMQKNFPRGREKMDTRSERHINT